MDLTESIIPRSDQANAEDLISGPRTVTIVEVRPGSAEQPVEIVTTEFGPARPFKPSKTVRRILVAAWGPDSAAYVGRRMTLYRDPSIRFGGEAVGGIRISHLSHITKPLTLALTITRGKRAPHVVQPLKEEAPRTQPDPRGAINAFAKAGITQAQLAERLGRDPGDWTVEDLNSLQVLFGRLQRNETTVDQEFPAASSTPALTPSAAVVTDPSAPDYDPTVDPNSGYEPPEQS